MAPAIWARASSNPSVQRSDSASNPLSPPVIISAADKSSPASPPWVTMSTPIKGGQSCAIDVAMEDAGRPAGDGELRRQGLGHGDRAVSPAGTADADRKIAPVLPL